MSLASSNTLRRQVYMVLSPRALSYATCALESLLRNSVDPIDLHLITDSADDKQLLLRAVDSLRFGPQHLCTVHSHDDLLDLEAVRFATFPSLRALRNGHPCWRKITDPLLLSAPGEELILLDPDLYFPNRFRFEPTPASGVLLMWQRPNCLFPANVVRVAMDSQVPLAHHVDIGVAHWRAPSPTSGPDLAWLDWLVSRLGGASLPRIMHVEAILWAAIAMHEGGGYLDPHLWRCWHRSQYKRIVRKLGADGRSMLTSEPWARIKCFHAGGEAKNFLPEAVQAGLVTASSDHLEDCKILPFEELTPTSYSREQSAKQVLRSIGYYHLFGAQ